MSFTQSSAIAERLISTATFKGYPRRGLYRRLSEICGVSDRASYKWVIGESAPSRSNAEKIAAAWGVTASYLLFGESPEEQPEFAAQRDTLPVPLQTILGLHQTNGLSFEDLQEIERFAALLASKNKSRAPASATGNNVSE